MENSVLKERWQKDYFSSNNVPNGIEFDDEEEERSEGIRLENLYKAHHHPDDENNAKNAVLLVLFSLL